MKAKPKPVRKTSHSSKNKPFPRKTQGYRWDLWEDGITQGAIRRFLDCPHQFWLSMVKGIRREGFKEAIEFGSAFHDIEANVSSTLSDHPGMKTTKVIDIHSRLYEGRRRERHNMSVSEETILESLLGITEIMLKDYLEQWEKQDRDIKWVNREEVFRVTYSVNNTHSLYLRGRDDGLFRNKKKQLRLLETKTKTRIDEQAIHATLPFDFQTMFYSLAARLTYDETPTGVLYNVIRKPLIQQKKDEYLHSYLERIRKDIEKRPGWYYMRWNVDFSPNDLDRWINRTLQPSLKRLVEWWESVCDLENPFDSPLHFMNPDALMTRYGTRSDLFDYITSGSSYGYTHKSVPFPELED